MEILTLIVFMVGLICLMQLIENLKQSIIRDEARQRTVLSQHKDREEATEKEKKRILCKTKGNANPKGKPRVYFTCHPGDVDKYFEKLCDDIFKTHDCAIFYTEDMSTAIAEEEKTTVLESNNLFVVPVTFKLLSTPNRAMDVDIPFALKTHIPVLPFMMEPGIDEFYSRPDKFGELQYLSPYSTDTTEVSYEEKLKKYLESVLISDEMAKRIRAAFDAYIFLSYRKKDRCYANELMRLIHNYPECRDIAIWYDEFLTPGESFRENIEKILSSSQLFALLVTPNLLEEPEGKPNFVMGREYPAAHKSGIDILPAEMEETDKATLSKKYQGIPRCVNPRDTEAFKLRLLESIAKIAVTANDDDPIHNFLIGLAYMEGIDVEVDRRRGLELITTAAETELPEAMKKLYNMYNDGVGVRVDYRESAKWAERLVAYYKKRHGEEHADTALWQSNLAGTYNLMGNYPQSIDLYEKAFTFNCKTWGEEHPNTITTLFNLAVNYNALGNYQKARNMFEKVYTLRCKVLGEEHPETIISLDSLAITFSYLGDYQKTLQLQEKAYTLCCKVLGEEHPKTLMLLNNLAHYHICLGDNQKALQLLEKAYTFHCKTLGKEHPHTLIVLSNLASTYDNLGEHQKALEANEKVYMHRCRILGEEHPDSLLSLNNLAFNYSALGQHQKSLQLQEKAYTLHAKVLGEEHPKTITVLCNQAILHFLLGNQGDALQLFEKGYLLRRKVLGDEHPDTQESLSILTAVREKITNS